MQCAFSIEWQLMGKGFTHLNIILNRHFSFGTRPYQHHIKKIHAYLNSDHYPLHLYNLLCMSPERFGHLTFDDSAIAASIVLSAFKGYKTVNNIFCHLDLEVGGRLNFDRRVSKRNLHLLPVCKMV